MPKLCPHLSPTMRILCGEVSHGLRENNPSWPCVEDCCDQVVAPDRKPSAGLQIGSSLSVT